MKKGNHLTEEHKHKISESHKGLKHSKNTIIKISEAHKNKFLSEETKIKMSKAQLLRKEQFGYINSPEARQKLSDALKGKTLTEKHRKNISMANKGKKKIFSEKHRKNLSKSNKGENNPQWKGGITPITVQIKNSIKYRGWRQDIFIRDDFTCQKCGTKGGNLNVHHIKSFSDFMEEIKNLLPLFSLYEGAMIYSPMWDKGNGITLCKKCHYKLHCKNNKEE